MSIQILRKSPASIAALFTLLYLASPFSATAQVPVGSPPPTYDFVPGEPGTQPPPALGGPFTARELFTFSLRVVVLVPLAQLQALLPPGFVATPFPAGSDTAFVNLQFNNQTRLERPGTGPGSGTFGPSGTFQIDTRITNPDNVAEGFFQLVHLVSDATLVPLRNRILGPGSSSAARFKFEMEDEEGSLRIKARVRHDGLGLDVKADATGPSAFANRFGGGLARSRFQNQDSPTTANPQILTVVHGDNAGAQPPENVRLNATQLQLPGGTLDVIGVGGFTFIRNLETFYRIP